MDELGFDIGKVDFKWVDETNKIKELKRAYNALIADGGHYADLEAHLRKKIISLDPKFQRHFKDQNISHTEVDQLKRELLDWESEVTEQDKGLRGENGADIF